VWVLSSSARTLLDGSYLWSSACRRLGSKARTPSLTSLSNLGDWKSPQKFDVYTFRSHCLVLRHLFISWHNKCPQLAAPPYGGMSHHSYKTLLRKIANLDFCDVFVLLRHVERTVCVVSRVHFNDKTTFLFLIFAPHTYSKRFLFIEAIDCSSIGV